MRRRRRGLHVDWLEGASGSDFDVAEALVYRVMVEEFAELRREFTERFGISLRTAAMLLHGLLTSENVMDVLTGAVRRMFVDGVDYSRIRHKILEVLRRFGEEVIRGIRDHNLIDMYT
ncbi:MAG: hypothetical protein ACTSXX_04895 [Candidatus Baldrarchaeia archaeon]